MKISPKYADRQDLSKIMKIRFSIEDRISESPKFQEFDRWLSRDDIDIGSAVFIITMTMSMPILILIGICTSITEDLFENPWIGIAASVIIVTTSCIASPWLLLFVIFFVIFCALLMFSSVMRGC